MPAPDERSGLGGVAVTAGAGLLMVVCCAGPLLLAGGALGGALAGRRLITVGAVILLAGAGYALPARSVAAGAPVWRSAARPSPLHPRRRRATSLSVMTSGE
ncbi:hypothetical protein GCM10022285_17160 [Streptomyces tunisiensis]|uniref:Uncharacterized protein n=1 Tax=Streptomyces tunisiensis TaxID=948699 RepID=A0ABP7Y4A7_9ACTN